MSPSDSPLTVKRAAIQAGWVAGYMVVAMSVYFLIAHDGNPSPLVTKTALDASIPLIPFFVWIYLSPYVVSPFLVVGAAPELFRALVKRGTVVVAIQLLCFFILPTVVDRDPLVVDAASSLSERLLQLVYEIDSPPRNAAPSGHVSLVIVLSWGASRSVGRFGPLVWVFCALVSASIVLTKQHHAVDLASGAALGALVLGGFWLWDRRHAAT